jgi:hypothetical protein
VTTGSRNKAKPKRVRRRGKATSDKIIPEIRDILRELGEGNLTIMDVRRHLRRRDAFPEDVYDNSVLTAELECIRKAFHGAKINVGTSAHKKYVREFGCYYIRQVDEDGKEEKIACWKAWADMDREQMESALIDLRRQFYRLGQITQNTFSYCNEMLRDRGETPLDRKEIDLRAKSN